MLADPVGRHRRGAGSNGVHEVDTAVPVEDDGLPGVRIDGGDEDALSRPVVVREPGRDDVAPSRRLGRAGRLPLQGSRTHPATHVVCVLRRRDDRVRPLQVVRARGVRCASSVGRATAGRWRGRLGEDGGIQLGGAGGARDLGGHGGPGRGADDEVGLGEVDAGVREPGDEAELPRVAGSSRARQHEGALVGMGPVGLWLGWLGGRPVPVPWVSWRRRGGGVHGNAFRGVLGGRPWGDYVSRAIVDFGGAPGAVAAFTGLTSCRRITIPRTVAVRRRSEHRLATTGVLPPSGPHLGGRLGERHPLAVAPLSACVDGLGVVSIC